VEGEGRDGKEIEGRGEWRHTCREGRSADGRKGKRRSELVPYFSTMGYVGLMSPLWAENPPKCSYFVILSKKLNIGDARRHTHARTTLHQEQRAAFSCFARNAA